jgi:hypothetical protein
VQQAVGLDVYRVAPFGQFVKRRSRPTTQQLLLPQAARRALVLQLLCGGCSSVRGYPCCRCRCFAALLIAGLAAAAPCCCHCCCEVRWRGYDGCCCRLCLESLAASFGCLLHCHVQPDLKDVIAFLQLRKLHLGLTYL